MTAWCGPDRHVACKIDAMLRMAITIVAVLAFASTAQAQIDPVRRDLVEFGYDQPIEGHAPVGAYVFYYLSRPQFVDADNALRLALSPVYLDGEWGVRNALGPQTDLAIGASGGGFASDYNEIRAGRWLRDQSFTGLDGGVDISAYHLFDPGARVPVYGILRGDFRYVAFERDSRNPPQFVLPDNQPIASVRAGLRAGGIEPMLAPEVAGELSAWYETQVRLNPGTYGFDADRSVQRTVQRFWGRALLVYTLPQLRHRIAFSIVGGTSVHPDRLSAWRIGGVLPLDSEFPLLLPGYYEGEFSARNFMLAGGDYAVPLDRAEHWQLGVGAAAARIGYTPGLEGPHAWNGGMSASLAYAPDTKAWRASLVYGRAFDAVRNGHRGADSISLLMEFDLERMGYLPAETSRTRQPD
jgi:hypothetical protein